MFAYQGNLFASGARVIPSGIADARRFDLGEGAWIDWCPSWLAGADAWFTWARDVLPWCQSERPMYDKVVAVPRLWCSFATTKPPEPMRLLSKVISAHYGRRVERFAANYYRGGDDSVAWHADRIAHPSDSVIAIVAVGEHRKFLIRPSCGGAATSFHFGGGDLLVMGGTAQRDWEHSVPKTAKARQRVSFIFRE